MRLALKIAIVSSGRTQRQLASVIGMNENRFSDIVQDVTNPRDDEREAISTALGVSADEIFGKRHVAPAGRFDEAKR